MALLDASPALAHEGVPPAPHDVWSAWSWEPTVLIGLAAAGVVYTLGVRRLWRAAGPGRSIPAWRTAAFAGGITALFVALISPLDAMGAALFSAHMVQHLMLLIVAPPLLVLGDPFHAAFWALPLAGRRHLAAAWLDHPRVRAAGGALTRPAVVWVVNVALLWFWHLPAAYGWALDHETAHAVEHASFLAMSVLFWWVLFRPAGPRIDRGAGILFVFTMGLQMSALGAILTFAGSAWYPGHAPWTAAWGLTPLEDQQLAGLIMWLPAGLVYLSVAAVLFIQWLERAGRPATRVSAAAVPGGRSRA
jgi:putative membrane protein